MSPPTEKVHGGYFIGTPVFGAATLADEEYLCQQVPVEPGCCYTLTGVSEVTGGGSGYGVVNVQFLDTAAACVPPLTADQGNFAPNPPSSGNHFLIPGPTQGLTAGFQNFTFVACAPSTANFACICIKNKGLTQLKIDSFEFFATGGPCTTCTNNP